MDQKNEEDSYKAIEESLDPNAEIKARRPRFSGRGKAFGIRALVSLAIATMLLSGGLWVFSRGNAEATLAGRVNGEGITREELSVRVEQIRKLHEKRNGKALFEGREGNEILARIRDQMLDEIILEKVVSQEARKAGFVTAPESEVARRLEEIKAASGLSESEIAEHLGVRLENLKSEISNQWAISQFIEKELLKNNPEDRDAFLQTWVSNAMQRAKVEKFDKPKLTSTARPSCCAVAINSAKPSCCAAGSNSSPGGPRTPRADIEKDAREKGLEYYERKTQRKGAEAKVTDFGCHIQVDILENGKVVLSLTYNQGAVEETRS